MNPQPSSGVRLSPFVTSGLEDGHGYEVKLRYGKPGDRLWVREAWAYYGGSEYLYQKEKRSTAFRATWDIDQYGWADAMGRGVPPIG